MPVRSWRWRGVGVTVTLSDSAAGKLRMRQHGPTTRGGLHVLEPTPQIHVKQRDPSHGLDFREEAEKGAAVRAKELDLATDAGDDLKRQVAEQSWYHTIELPGGVVTPGQFDHRPVLPHYGFPSSLKGKRVLDAATFNGFWAFHMEKLGGDVVAIDLDDPADWDFPTPIREQLVSRGPRAPIRSAFDIAHAALGSKVQRVSRSIYDLDPEVDGTFDLIHSGDVLLHLRDPLRALEGLRRVASGELLLVDLIDLDAPPTQFGPSIQYMGGWNDVNWWIPSLDALAQMVVDAGFRNVKVNSVYSLAKTYETDGYWRASLSATV